MIGPPEVHMVIECDHHRGNAMSIATKFLGPSLLSFMVLISACTPASTPQPTTAPAAPKEAAKPAEVAKPAEPAKPAEAAKPVAEPKAAAKIGGKLNVLGGPQPDWMQAQVRAFQEKTGIETEFVRKSGGEGLAQLKAEGNNPSFDVWWGTPIDSFISAQADGLLENFIPPSAAELAAQHKDATGAWHGIYLGSIGWAVNTKRLQEKNLPEPQTWDDLIKPEYRGEVVMAHPATSGTAYTTVQTVLQIKGEDKGWDYFKALHRNVLQYTKSGSAPMRMLEGSEAAIGIVFSHDIFVSIEKGLPIKLVFPQDGTGYEVGGMGIIKGAKNLEQAKQWVEWSLTPEAQEIGPTVKAYQAPTNPKAKVSRPEFMQVKLINYDFQLAGKTEERVRTRFLEEIAPAPKD
jgi:iron(III) transport system substrate-binding protein